MQKNSIKDEGSDNDCASISSSMSLLSDNSNWVESWRQRQEEYIASQNIAAKEMDQHCCNRYKLHSLSRRMCYNPEEAIEDTHRYYELIYCASSGMPVHHNCSITLPNGLHLCYQHAESLSETIKSPLLKKLLHA